MVVFVGDRPSRLNISPDLPFVGTPSFNNLTKWINKLDISSWTAVNSYTHDDFVIICQLYNSGLKTFVALGNNASTELDRLGIKHFKLPHPSPRNRKLNDANYIDSELEKCKNYLKGTK